MFGNSYIVLISDLRRILIFSRYLLALLVTVALGIETLKVSEASEWRDLDSDEHLLLFNPPFIRWNPGITVSVADFFAGRSEILLWGNSKSTMANAGITFQKIGNRKFRYRTASNVPGFYKAIRDAEHTVLKETKMKYSHPINSFNTVRFEYHLSSGLKNCVAFSTMFSGRRRYIEGWLCAPANKTLSESVVEKMISTIGLKGRYEPERVTYSSLQTEALSSEDASLDGGLGTKARETDPTLIAEAQEKAWANFEQKAQRKDFVYDKTENSKAAAICVDWLGDPPYPIVGYAYWSWGWTSPAGAKQKALSGCEQWRSSVTLCYCQLLKLNDDMVLEVPKEARPFD